MAAQQPKLLDNLIKPDQVFKIPLNIDTPTRQKYHAVVTTCWQRIQSRPQGSQEYQDALQRLTAISTQFKEQMRKFQEQRAQQQQREAANQQNGMRPQNSGQPTQPRQPNQQAPAQNQQSQPPQQVQHPNPPNRGGMSAKVVEAVRNFQYVAPPNIQNGSPNNVNEYITEARSRHAKALSAYENSIEQLQTLEQVKTDKLAQQNGLSPQDEVKYNESKERILKQREEARTFIQKFVEAQNKLKADMGLLNQGGAGSGQMKRDPSQNGGGIPPNLVQGNQGQPHTVSSAITAARSHSDASEGGKPAMTGIPNGQAQVNQPANTQQSTQAQTPQVQPSNNVKSEDRTQESTVKPPQPTATPHAPPSNPPFPDTSMQRSQSFTNAAQPNSFTPNGPQHTPHGHPPQPRIGGAEQPQMPNNHHNSKFSIPKELSVATPTPVAMGPSRPTLTGGPISSASIGQPAIVRHPGYVLEGDGERVLSKKKLEELFRQVTGSTGAETDESEMLSPDVEEVSHPLIMLTKIVFSVCAHMFHIDSPPSRGRLR